MKELVLKCGAIVLLDDEDYERIPKTGWYLSKKECHNPNTDYAQHDKYGKMHRWILGMLPNKKPKLVVDHINRNGLDNRKENLRLITTSLNKRNQSTTKNNCVNFSGIGLEINKKYRTYRFRARWSEGEPIIDKRDNKPRAKQKTKNFSFNLNDLDSIKSALKKAILFRVQKMRDNNYELDERSTTIERMILENENIDIERILNINLSKIISSRVEASASKKESPNKG